MTNNNLNILPFYDSIYEQNHRKSYAYGDIFSLVCSNSKLLPFQIVRKHKAGAPVTKLMLYNLDTGVQVNILSEAVAAGLNTKEFAGNNYDLIINPSALVFPNLKNSKGLYYLEISDGTNTWFSEVFTVVDNLADFMKLEYWDNDNLEYKGGHIDYGAPFKNYCYIKSEIGKPEYPFEEEAQKRDGYTFIEKQISEKKYKFEFPAPEYLCDAFRIVRMHDFINIHFAGKTYNVENIIFEPKWKDQGNIAIMEVEFECDTVLKKTGKGVVQTGGDFNNDFNNDFK